MAVAEDVRPGSTDIDERQTDSPPNLCIYNGADNSFSEGADRDPNGGGVKEGDKGGQGDEVSEEEDAGSEEGNEEGETKVKVEEVSDGTEDKNMKGL